jgi:hypothetical protein
MSTDDQPPAPSERLPITYFGSVILTVRSASGSIYVSVADLCDAIGFSRSTATRRIRNHSVLARGLTSFTVRTAGGNQSQEFLELEQVPALLLMINANRTRPEVREKLEHLQLYLVREVYAAFARLTGLPEQESRQIEDLEDLRRLDTALNALAERQAALEASQDRAREAYRDLRQEVRQLTERLHALEGDATPTISKAQRGHLYQLVQAIGAERAQREAGRITQSAAYAGVWAAFKLAFGLARYEDLPASRYEIAVAFLKAEYRRLTGKDLELPEQGELDL